MAAKLAAVMALQRAAQRADSSGTKTKGSQSAEWRAVQLAHSGGLLADRLDVVTASLLVGVSAEQSVARLAGWWAAVWAGVSAVSRVSSLVAPWVALLVSAKADQWAELMAQA